MKRLEIIATLLFTAGIAYGAGGTQPSLVYQVGVSSITTTIVTVSTSTVLGVTKVDSPTLLGRVVVEIDNIDASANLWCLPVNSPTVNNARKITAGSSWIIAIADRMYTPTDPTKVVSATNTNFFCISDGATPTKAAVTQLY